MNPIFSRISARVAFTVLSVIVTPMSLAANGSGNQPDEFLVNQVFSELPDSLKKVSPPLPPQSELGKYIRDPQLAVVLGKALFWDSQVGSDGEACASCHFQAGADNRIKNQIDPGLRNASGKLDPATGAPIGESFNALASNSGKGPNYSLKKADFPFHRTSDPEDRNSEVSFDSDDVVSSQGVYQSTFNALKPSGKKESCRKRLRIRDTGTYLFSVGGHSVRQVEPRNTPTVINAVYNFRNFWDGRANNIFNGLDPFGRRRPYNPNDPAETNIRVADAAGNLSPIQVNLSNSSLASQAVGPALSDMEMSCAGKTFPTLGRKLLAISPLGQQKVDATDSVLGPYAAAGKGLRPKYSYAWLIQQVFKPNLWKSAQLTDGYTQMENNFSLFWGLAIQAYEATLVANDSRVDRFKDAQIPDPSLLSDEELMGFNVFQGKGRCAACHLGPELTGASATHVAQMTSPPSGTYLERMMMGDGEVALYDSGFYNIGVRPTEEDLGIGATDPWGNPLSFTRTGKRVADGWTNPLPLGADPFLSNSNFFDPTQPNLSPVSPDERDAVDGAFKTPGLRNVELTGPYFHNGGTATLEQVVAFYERGGDRRDRFDYENIDWFGNPAWLGDNSASMDAASNGQVTNLAPDIAGTKDLLTVQSGVTPEKTLQLSPDDVSNLVAFLKALTDDRVRWEKAPFDHPSLKLPNGHVGDDVAVKFNPKTNQALQEFIDLPAVGAAGRAAKNLPPLQSFDAGLK